MRNTELFIQLTTLEKRESELLKDRENIQIQLKRVRKQQPSTFKGEESNLLAQRKTTQVKLRENRQERLAIYLRLKELCPECEDLVVGIKILETILAVVPEPSK